MLVQLVIILLALFVCISMSSKGDDAASRHTFVTFLAIVLVLQSSLRHLSVGPDTYSFLRQWNFLGSESWQNVFYSFYEVYFLGIGKDGGFLIVLKLLYSLLGGSFYLFLFVYGLMFFFPMMRLLEKNLSSMWQIFMGFCLYQVLFYSFFSISGMRQGMATIATFYCVQWARDKKWVRYLIAIFLASFIHKSVLLFAPFYLLCHFRKTKTAMICAFALFPVVFVMAHSFAGVLVDLAGAEQYGMYSSGDDGNSGALKFTIMLAFIAILTLVARFQNPESIPDFVINSMAVALMLSPLTWVDSSLMRVVQYYSIFSMIALPLSIDGLKMLSRDKKLLYWGIWAVLMFVVIRHDYVYYFFWQDVPINSIGN